MQIKIYVIMETSEGETKPIKPFLNEADAVRYFEDKNKSNKDKTYEIIEGLLVNY
ncbi:hypothetical protein [Brevibacillus reuszeri]|uniref:hypothetical protein n=1 Tax=Brevibacillus reuszeri TaxID=54915 RepID=UPI003D1DB458